ELHDPDKLCISRLPEAQTTLPDFTITVQREIVGNRAEVFPVKRGRGELQILVLIPLVPLGPGPIDDVFIGDRLGDLAIGEMFVENPISYLVRHGAAELPDSDD